MLFIVTYLAVFLLTYAGNGYHGPRSLTTSWRAKNPAYALAAEEGEWGSGVDEPEQSEDVEQIRREMLSPAAAVDFLDWYIRLIQSPAIRSNYQLRAAKAQQNGSSPFYGATLGEWWASRRLDAVLENPAWFDGTIAEGLLDAINVTVNRHIPQLLSVQPGWNYEGVIDKEEGKLPKSLTSFLSSRDAWDEHGEAKEIALDDRQNIVAHLDYRARIASEFLRAASLGQNKTLPTTTRTTVDRLVSNARDLVSYFEDIDRVSALMEADHIRERSESWCGSAVESDFLGIKRFVKWTLRWILCWQSDTIHREFKPRLEDEVIPLCTQQYARFLLDESRNSISVREEIYTTYENLRRGIMIVATEIEPIVDGVLIGLRMELDKLPKREGQGKQQGNDVENADGVRKDRVEELFRDLKKIAHIRRAAEVLVAAAANTTRELDDLTAHGQSEADVYFKRPEVIDKRGIDGPYRIQHQKTETDEATGKEYTVYYIYEYSLGRLSPMAKTIRDKADELEHVWDSIRRCESNLLYLNICEALRLDATQRQELVVQEFEERTTALEIEPPTCNKVGNPYFLNDICRVNYVDS